MGALDGTFVLFMAARLELVVVLVVPPALTG